MNITEYKNGNSHMRFEEPTKFEDFISDDFLSMNDYRLIPTESGALALVNDRKQTVYTLEIYGASDVSELLGGRKFIVYPYKHDKSYDEMISMYDEKGYLEW